jgi:hypothetical protein
MLDLKFSSGLGLGLGLGRAGLGLGLGLVVCGLDYNTGKNAQVVTGLQTSCNKSVHKLSTSCVPTACSQLLEQVVNNL